MTDRNEFAFSLVHAPIGQISPYFEGLTAYHLEEAFPERRDEQGHVGFVSEAEDVQWPIRFQHAHLAYPAVDDGSRPSDSIRRAIQKATPERAAELERMLEVQLLAETDPDALERLLIDRLEQSIQALEDPLLAGQTRRDGMQRITVNVEDARRSFSGAREPWKGPVGEVRLSPLARDDNWTLIDGPMGELLRPDWLLPLSVFADLTILTLQYRQPDDRAGAGVHHAEYHVFANSGLQRQVTTTWEKAGEGLRLKTYAAGRYRSYDPRPLKPGDHIGRSDLNLFLEKLGVPLNVEQLCAPVSNSRLIGLLEGSDIRPLDRSALPKARQAQRQFETKLGSPWEYL